MAKKQVSEALENHRVLKYGASKVYVIGMNELNGTAQIKMAAQPDLPPIDVKFSELKEN